MARSPSTQRASPVRRRDLPGEFRLISRSIFREANRGVPTVDFLQQVATTLMHFARCSAVGLRLKDGGKILSCEVTRGPRNVARFECCPVPGSGPGDSSATYKAGSALERLCVELLQDEAQPPARLPARSGSCWVADTVNWSTPKPGGAEGAGGDDFRADTAYRSVGLIPLCVGDERVGLLQLKWTVPNGFSREDAKFYDQAATTLAVALLNQRTQAALRERVKELTCLYGIAHLARTPSVPLEEALQRIAELLPPAWQYPDLAVGRITVDGRTYTTAGHSEGAKAQTADIVAGGRRRGVAEVRYRKPRPDLDEGPFLKEERSLIDAIAGEISLMIEQREAAQEKHRLHDQLRHADRLATIGQLAAGVAHELNEPLGNILGFAQLAQKCPGLPSEASRDLEMISSASLHAREIVKKLMLFARQTPPRKVPVDLNQVIAEGLYFLSSRCAKHGIELVQTLCPSLPTITADPSQLHQVLVNLVVNAIQAMPDGGRLTVSTDTSDGRVRLMVQDTGAGMSDDVLQKIFMPFFTTKGVGEGTGLGLSVVHGIVTSHGGSVNVESRVGQGTRIEVRLPAGEAQEPQHDGEG